MIERKNLFKTKNVFQCVHDVHRHFKSAMSPHHILIEKNCFPDGCIYFQWKCRLLAKQKKCFRNFEKVGKKCFNCKYFYEEKIHQYPEIMVSKENYTIFQENFADFVEWLNQLQKQRILAEGKVKSIKPDLTISNIKTRNRINLRGFLVEFSCGYLDNQFFDDPFYLSISSLTQNKLKIRKDDNLEFEANLSLDRGRLKLYKSGKFHFIERGAHHPPNRGDLLVALSTATIQPGQPLKCMRCSKGILSDLHGSTSGPRRAIVCVLGIPDYQLCTYVEPEQNPDNTDTCANPKWKNLKCNQIL
jgi:hypothetical protein